MQSIRTMLVTGTRKFRADAEKWAVTRRDALAIALFPFIVVGSVALIGVLAVVIRTPFHSLFRWVTAEDSLLEWLQFVAVCSASLIFAWLGVHLVRAGHRGMGVLYLLLALGAFFVSGEEISWGQRIFGWGTPESLETINHQGETNVHNIRWVQSAFGYMILCGAMYGTIAPLIGMRFWPASARSSFSYLIVPPLCLVPAFLMPFGYKIFRLVIWPGTNFTVVKFGEAPELCLYFGLLVFAWLNVRRLSLVNRPSIAETIPTT